MKIKWLGHASFLITSDSGVRVITDPYSRGGGIDYGPIIVAAVDFNRDVRPLLADKCFACHGPDESHREADLRLDVRDEALADRGGYQALAPGKPTVSVGRGYVAMARSNPFCLAWARARLT